MGLYGSNVEAYCGVRPGMTGLWQVSGRNNTTFEERARFDIYYIRNWSLLAGFLYPSEDGLGSGAEDGAY